MRALAAGIVLAACLAAPGAGKAQTCVSPTHTVTVVGLAGAAVPAVALSPLRQAILVCNSIENPGSPVVKCREDGTMPVMGVAGPGEALAKGDCITYRAPSGKAVKCISDTAGTVVHAEECK
jgi:hypothetical protein